MQIPNFENIRAIDKDGNFTPEWRQILSQLIQEMQRDLSDEGFYPPQLTTAQVAELNTTDSIGAVVFNIETGKLMVNESGTFKTIQTL